MTRQTPNIAIFCDYENIAIGVRDARYDEVDIARILERLLDKGNIVVKKAYADWSRYKHARKPLHEAAFELIEIPHVSYSGKNSADIRLVVDALDLCYTKEHVHIFVVVSGDSDFSPLVSKLRENNKQVIGLGVKNSSADLLIDNCDEFIYYDDLVRTGTVVSPGRRPGGRHQRTEPPAEAAERDRSRGPQERSAERPAEKPERPVEPLPAVQPPPVKTPPPPPAELEALKQKAIERVLDTVDALFREKDDNIWGSHIKQTLKRKQPEFSEAFHGYRTFNHLLEDMQKRGLLELQKDEKSGGYLVLGFGPSA